jgi:hypothetical protein
VAYNFQTGKNKIKLLTEYEDVSQKVFFGNAVLAALMSGRKYDVIPQIGDVVTEFSMEKFHLHIMLSDVGQSNFKRLVVFCTEKERRSKQLHRKCWRTLAGKLNTAWTYYVPRKARMLKLFSILQYLF